MEQYARGSEGFYSALSILRNKITGMANDALTHNGTVLTDLTLSLATNLQFILLNRN